MTNPFVYHSILIFIRSTTLAFFVFPLPHLGQCGRLMPALTPPTV